MNTATDETTLHPAEVAVSLRTLLDYAENVTQAAAVLSGEPDWGRLNASLPLPRCRRLRAL